MLMAASGLRGIYRVTSVPAKIGMGKPMRLYSYVVKLDYGFAPNPFYGVCTLATCKPKIRENAQVGDWIVGTGSARYSLSGRLVFYFRVEETLSYDEYWADQRFRIKRPNLRGSLKQAFGDNIYHRHKHTKEWVQLNSHHSHKDGRPNQENLRHDTQAPRMLVGNEFAYWGEDGPAIPEQYRSTVCALRGHKCRFSQDFLESFLAWLLSLEVTGYLGPPREFRSFR